MITPHRVCGIGLLVAALASAPLRADAAVQSPTELLTQGDAKASDGDHAEAARLYHQAYEKMSADERADMGELVVEAALESVRKAYAKSEDPTLLELTASLIEDFESDMSGDPPEFIEAANQWLEDHPPPDTGEEDPYLEDEDPDFGDDDPVNIGTTGPTGNDAPAGREVVGPVLIGAGGALAVTGIVLLALGAPVGGKAEDARDEAFASPELAALLAGSGTDMMMAESFMTGYDTYVDDENNRGKSMMIAGGVVLGVGVGLAVYGAVRIVQHRKKKKQAAQLIPTGGGFMVRF